MRFPLPFVVPLLALALASGALAACPDGPKDRQAAVAAAHQAAQQQLTRAASVYSLLYANVGYDVKVGQTTIRGNVASVRGHLTLRGTERRSGQPASGTYAGTVFLKRDASCVWRVTGYKREK